MSDLDEVLEAGTDEKDSSESLAENQLYDYITNQPVKDNPTERTLQSVARSLVDEYGFDHTQLQRDQTIVYEIYDENGRTKRVRRKVEIAVFAENTKRDDQSEIIRICMILPPGSKANDRKRGIGMLEEMLGALPNCDYGLWTNGTELAFRQKIMTKKHIQPEYVDLYDLPGYGETAADLDKIDDRKVGRIATGDNLVRTFARVHDYIYGNQGLRGDAAFWQVLNLIFCKIHDERATGERRFWVKGTERNDPAGQAAIAKRIRELFAEVKNDPISTSVFSANDKIELNNKVLAFAVGELSRYNLIETDVDVKGAAYEEITSNMLKQQRGQFFTPTNVIRCMVEMMNPGGDVDLTNSVNWPRILDPACGSGRFLTYALDHIRHKIADQLYTNEHPLLRLHRLEKDKRGTNLVRKFAEASLYGIDFDPDLKRAARMNMILNNDGHGNILSFNSLEFPNMLGGKSVREIRVEYGNQPKEQWLDTARARLEADFGTFDFVFTNPPFGAKIPIDDPRVLENFELGHRWYKDDDDRWYKSGDLQSRVAPEVLFVERCVQWAKPGTGRVAIVLPDGILGNPDAESIRYWILKHCQVLASVDLPVEAFLPQVGVQASLLFLRRKTIEEMDAEALGQPADYNVFMAVAEAVGHDRRGNTVYVRDADGAEVIFNEPRTILQRRGGHLRPSTMNIPEKRVDDDLPKVSQAYIEFLKPAR
jgi:type I restriction enzyme M protein